MRGARLTQAAPDPGPAAERERASFESTVRDHLDALYAYCLRLTEDRADAEDLIQETLVRALRGYDAIRSMERVRSWLFTITTNAWRDSQRARGRRPATVPLDEQSDEDFSLFATLVIEDPNPYSDELHLDFLRLFRDEDMQQVFATVPPTYRLPLILTTIHGFSCKEAAAILDIPLGTLLSRLHRGRRRLERGLWDYAVNRGLVRVTDDEPD